MAFFKASKPLLTWREPPLFSARTRDRRGWAIRGGIVFLIFAVMLFAGLAQRKWGRKGPKFSVPASVVIAGVVALVFGVMLEAPDLNRDVTIFEDEITSLGNAGEHFQMSRWPLREVQGARLIRPAELGRDYGVLELKMGKKFDRVGIAAGTSLSRIAEVLHGRGLPVRLAGWAPAAASPSMSPAEPPLVPPLETRTTASAKVERLDEGEAGQILNPPALLFCGIMAIGPLFASFGVGLGFILYEIYRLKFLNQPGRWQDLAVGGGGMALLLGGGWFTLRFSNLAPSLMLRSRARAVVELRPAALFDPRDPEASYVDVIPRQNWGKGLFRESSDVGLLKVDPTSKTILFEGDRERWRIPAGSLISVEVESYRPKGHVEGQRGGEQYHVAVIRANVDGKPWEAAVARCHVEPRPKDNRLREANARAIRDQVRSIWPLGPRR